MRPGTPVPASVKLGFNPRICKRCDRKDQYIRLNGICFNPRICKRCDIKNPQGGRPQIVSIHASVKDATNIRINNDLFQGVSIHASVKDATSGPIMGTPTMIVSIHASVKDATYKSPHKRGKDKFQSTHL